MSDREIKELWEDFADIPLDDEERIESPFYIWEIGTEKEEIWHWFDRNYRYGVASLLYFNGEPIK